MRRWEAEAHGSYSERRAMPSWKVGPKVHALQTSANKSDIFLFIEAGSADILKMWIVHKATLHTFHFHFHIELIPKLIYTVLSRKYWATQKVNCLSYIHKHKFSRKIWVQYRQAFSETVLRVSPSSFQVVPWPHYSSCLTLYFQAYDLEECFCGKKATVNCVHVPL